MFIILIQASSRHSLVFLLFAGESRSVIHTSVSCRSWSLKCLGTWESLLRVLMSYLSSSSLYLAVRPVSPMYTCEHYVQEIIYTTLLVLQLLCPIILCFLCVVGDVIV